MRSRNLTLLIASTLTVMAGATIAGPDRARYALYGAACCVRFIWRVREKGKGVKLNLPRFDAHSLTGTIVPKESKYVDPKKTNLQFRI